MSDDKGEFGDCIEARLYDPMPWGRPPYACEHIAALKARFLGEAWARAALREIDREVR